MFVCVCVLLCYSQHTFGLILFCVIITWFCSGFFKVKLNGHRQNRPKRNVPADLAVQEDIEIKKRMLELMEESNRHNADNIQQINTNIAKITSTIQEGFSLMRMLLLQPHTARSSSGGDGQFQRRPHTPEDHTTHHSGQSPTLDSPQQQASSHSPSPCKDRKF